MQLLIGIIVGLLILCFLVVVHELGHAIVAARNGVVVEEFGIGFPPRAWARKLKNGVLFTLNWLPLGGFVKMQGENDAADKPGDFGAATFWGKTKIMFAGVVINWLVAAALLTILAWTGLPKVVPNQFHIKSDTTFVESPVQIGSVIKGSAADKAALKTGDKLLRFAGATVPTSQSLADNAKAHSGQTVDIIYSRKGKEHIVHATIAASNKDNKGYLGVGLSQEERLRATWSAPIVGVVTTGQFTAVTFQGLGDLFANLGKGIFLQLSPNHHNRQQASADLSAAGDSVAGPVGILGVIFPAAEQAGLTQLTLLTAIISLTLAVMNVLPVPALDGGRWYMMALFRLFKKPLTKDREEKIVGTSFLTLLALIVIVTVSDVGKLL